MTECCWRLQRLADRLPAVNKGGNLDVLSLLSLRDANIPVELHDSQRNFTHILIFPSMCIYKDVWPDPTQGFLPRCWWNWHYCWKQKHWCRLSSANQWTAVTRVTTETGGPDSESRVSPPLTLSADTHRDTRHLSTQTRRKKLGLVGGERRFSSQSRVTLMTPALTVS